VTGKMNSISAETLTRFTSASGLGTFGTVYVNLLTAGPANDGTVTTAADGTEWLLARLPIQTTEWNTPAIVPGNPNAVQITNGILLTWADITFDTTADPVVTTATVTHIGVWSTFDDPESLLYWDELEVARTVNNGDTFQLGTGKLRIRED